MSEYWLGLRLYWLRLVEFLWLWFTPDGRHAMAIRSGKGMDPQGPVPPYEPNAPDLAPPVKTPEELEAEAALSAESIAAARARVKAHFAAKQREGRSLVGRLPTPDFKVASGKEVTIEVEMHPDLATAPR